MILFWTSSQFFIHIGECRLSYCIDKNFSNSLQLFVFFECWALIMTSKKVNSIMHPHHVIGVTELLEQSLIQSLVLTHHCYSLPCVYFLTFTTVITSQHGVRLITVTGIWICIILSCIFLRWICTRWQPVYGIFALGSIAMQPVWFCTWRLSGQGAVWKGCAGKIMHARKKNFQHMKCSADRLVSD